MDLNESNQIKCISIAHLKATKLTKVLHNQLRTRENNRKTNTDKLEESMTMY